MISQGYKNGLRSFDGRWKDMLAFITLMHKCQWPFMFIEMAYMIHVYKNGKKGSSWSPLTGMKLQMHTYDHSPTETITDKQVLTANVPLK